MQFAYVGPRIRGASTTFQQWTITPAQSNMSFNTNDVIKFMGNISQGLYDPYRSHFQITVQVDNEIGLLQLDNGAHSMVNQMILLSRQTQIQRIQQYDVLGSMLNDIGFSQIMCQNKTGEGIGYTNIPTNIASSCVRPQPSKTSYKMPQDKTTYMTQYANFGGYLPTMAPNSSFTYFDYSNPNSADSIQSQSNLQAQNLGSGFRTYGNYLSYPYDIANINKYIQKTNRALNVRCQNVLGPLTNGYPNAPWSTPPAGISVSKQKWSYSNMLSAGYTPGVKYQTSYQLQTPDITDLLRGTQGGMPATCSQVGYGKPFASAFCVGANQPFISAVVPQVQMRNGVILSQPIACSTKTFRMPFISGVLGIAIPPDQFQLIPAASMKDITLQLSLNPYAFFTSGYSDVHEFDTNGMQITNMQKRKWRYTTFNWVWHLYTFNKQQIMADIKTKLFAGITISSNFWQLTSSYQLPNGAYARNSFGIPVNVQSLAQILIAFLSNQYTTKSFCRKQFRLSNNISSLQFKANGSYYPLQPIQGNAGNPQQIDTTGDNWNFYEQLLLSNNFLFNTNVPLPRINQKNFAINGRIYDSNNTDTLFPPKLYNMTQPDWDLTTKTLSAGNDSWNKINGSTAMGMSWFHQNRYIGRAIFSWTFQPYGHSKGTISGLNTTNYRQFDVTINTIPDNQFPTDETLCIFTRSNVIVRYFDGYIQVLGA